MISTVLSSSTAGNIIGLLSLVVSVAGLVWTYITYRTTKRIEKRLPEERASAINNLKFKEYRHETKKMLVTRQTAVKDTGRLTRRECGDLLEVCNRIIGYSDMLDRDDNERIVDLCARTKELNNMIKTNKESAITHYIEITTQIFNILDKGEYDI